MVSLSQSSFAGGEISPALWGRTDWERYAISLKTCRNFIVTPYGGIKNRPGTQYMGSALSPSTKVRIIPFTFSGDQAYVLELGVNYALPHYHGSPLRFPDTYVIAAYNAGTTYAFGEIITDSDIGYMSLADGNVGNTPSSSPTYWLNIGGDASTQPYNVMGTPYGEDDLFGLTYTQSASILTLCHEDYNPRQISRTVDANGVLFAIESASFVNGPFDDKNTDTSLTVYASAVSGTAVTLTASGDVFSTTDDVGKLFYIEQKNAGSAWVPLTGMTVADIKRSKGKYWYALASGTTGTDQPGYEDTEAVDDWDDGGINWRYLHPGFGVVGITGVSSTTSATCIVISRIPDACVGSGNTTYKWAKGAWCEANGYPSCTTYHQQRQAFGGSPGFPQTLWLSRTGDYPNFGKSSPLVDDDVLIYPLSGRQVNSVRHLMTLNGALLAFTTDSIWSITGNDNQGVLTPTVVQAKPQTALGSSRLMPILVGNTSLYVQDKGQSVHDLIYSFADDAYSGDDLSVFATHLTEGYTIDDWAYQCVPYSIIWCVRSDGVLLGLTYSRAQKMIGWHRHDIGSGEVESVCVVSEGDEDVPYLLVKRTINGSEVRYIEKLTSRLIADEEDAFFVDSGLSYDGWNASATTIALSGGTTYGYGEEITMTASAATFSYPAQTDVDDSIVYVDATTGTRYEITITSTTSTTVAKGIPNKTIPAAYRVARTDWGFARDTMSGLGHLEGETVAILNDGNVETRAVVSSGSISLARPGCKVHVGLPIQADIETLDLTIQGAETIRDKNKSITSVSVLVERSRGLWIGQTEDTLVEWKQRDTEIMDVPIQSTTGLAEVVIGSDWSKDVRLFIRQDDPLPLSILSIIPQVDIGG